ncbi:MmgE/PrpD family protein [Nonomuraea sp. PA05]|uniref:MmgE/PrpD family protein n=1 Tax=Nonomuraea sp. PA05 TaxID=2604466 RepID=UPI0011DA1277|nr:MmgE/PrpD family protein [Nonomuraea sp. PA05]TYB57400.1 MmgE/PrpD family protein [Nonomuraea sp. PA05]
MSGATAGLAGFASGLAFADLPPEVVERITWHLLDAVGAGLAGSAKPWNAVVRRYALRETAPGPCTVYGTGATARPEWAALANATAGHGFEIDDYALPALAHPGCVVVPAVLAVGEELGADGREALAAAAAGFETVVRFGLATTPSLTSDRGFHVTGVHGVFGAAAVACRLRGLDPGTTASAYGLAASQAGGVTEYTRSGGEVKRLHAGLAAMAGIRSATLAGDGFTGPRTAVEGPRGLLRAFAAHARPAALTDGLGERWELHGLALKRYCVCAGIQAPLQALAELRAELPDPREIEEVVVGVDDATRAHVGAAGADPRDMTEAQFSARHAVAMHLVLGGNGPEHYARLEAAGFDLPEVSALAGRVRLEHDAEAEAAFPARLLARVRVRLRDGREPARLAEAPGSPGAPMPGEEVEAKFLGLAGGVIGDRAARAVRDAVRALADGGPVAAVLEATRRKA